MPAWGLPSRSHSYEREREANRWSHLLAGWQSASSRDLTRHMNEASRWGRDAHGADDRWLLVMWSRGLLESWAALREHALVPLSRAQESVTYMNASVEHYWSLSGYLVEYQAYLVEWWPHTRPLRWRMYLNLIWSIRIMNFFCPTLYNNQINQTTKQLWISA